MRIDTLDPTTLHLLSAPLGDLSDREAAFAIELAREAGDQASEVGARVMPDYLDRFPAEGMEYLITVLGAAASEGVLDAPAHVLWRRAVDEGDAMLDPRVQAFCAAWTQRAAFLADPEVEERATVLARFLETSAGSVRVATVGPNGHPLFASGSGRYLVLRPPEAEGLGARLTHDSAREPLSEVEYEDALRLIGRSPDSSRPAPLAGIRTAVYPFGPYMVLRVLATERGD